MAESAESSPQTTAPADALRVDIDHVVRRAEDLATLVDTELPGHPGLHRAAHGVALAARQAEVVSRKLARFWTLHRLPVLFVAVALTGFGAWIYWQFFHVSTLTIGLPDRDAIQLHEWLARRGRVQFREVTTQGSREGAALVNNGEVDLAFIQGGIPIPPHLPRLESVGAEMVLFFVRDGIEVSEIRTILTSVHSQGSHSVALNFLTIWGIEDEVRFLHEWKSLIGETDYEIPPRVDAVFVVKDPTNEKALLAAERLRLAGFYLTSPSLGVRESQLDYLTQVELPAGHLNFDPPVPAQPVSTYSVSTFLVAREGLTPRLLAAATHLLDSSRNTISERSFELTVADASELLQGVDAVLGILVTIGLSFLALLGLDVVMYRRRFNELNSLISLISMHQSSRDVIGLDPPARAHNVNYLRVCGDLLGLISVLTSYYAQENSSLLYNNLLTIIPERCNSLKLNIQLKILHANIDLTSTGSQAGVTTTPQETAADLPADSSSADASQSS